MILPSPSTVQPFVQDSLVGRAAVLCGNCREQGGLEPASVLVTAFEIEVCRPLHVGVVFENVKMRAAAVEPAVESVCFFDEVGTARTWGI